MKNKTKGKQMFIRLCEGLADKGKLVADTDNPLIYTKKSNKDYYVSIFKYTKEQKKQFEEKGTISGITNVKTNKLIFDFDAKNLDLARKDALSVIDILKNKNIPEDAINIYFSGGKGFHVSLTLNQYLNPHEIKSIAKKIANGLKTFDDKIYNASRIIRMPNTLHQKSNLYKTRILLDELRDFSIEDIKDIAKQQYEYIAEEKIDLPKQLYNLIQKETTSNDSSNSLEMYDFNDICLEYNPKQNPFGLSPWKNALFQGFYPPGQRSNSLMIIAATLKSKGLNKQHTFSLLQAINTTQSRRHKQLLFDEEELNNNILKQVYGPNWQGKTYAEENFPQALQDYLISLGLTRKYEEDIFNDTDNVFNIFDDFATNIEKNTIKTGISNLDDNLQLTTSMLVGWLGAPSSGKTSTALDILRHTSMNNENATLFSMDMGAPLVYQRLAQKVTGYSTAKLFKIFKEDQKKEKEKIRYLISKNFKNVDFCFKTALTVQGIRQAIKQKEDKTGKKIRLAVIDYLECISSDISDSTAKISMISQELKDMANDLKTCVILLLQPPKRAGDPSFPLLSYTDIKGAATVGQACSVVVSLWREGFNPANDDNDRFMSFAVLKNRMGRLTQIDCGFDGLTGDIYNLDDSDYQSLKQLRELKKIDNNDSI